MNRADVIARNPLDYGRTALQLESLWNDEIIIGARARNDAVSHHAAIQADRARAIARRCGALDRDPWA
jgi:hypothetical protein